MQKKPDISLAKEFLEAFCLACNFACISLKAGPPIALYQVTANTTHHKPKKIARWN